MKNFTKTFTTISVLAIVATGAYITGKFQNDTNSYEPKTIQTTEQSSTSATKILKVDDSTAVEKNVAESTVVEDNENYLAEENKGEFTVMTVDPSQIGIGVGGAGITDGHYFAIVKGEKVGSDKFSFYVISYKSSDCIKVVCDSSLYQKAWGFADYMNELAPNGTTKNGLESNFNYYMNN